MSIKSEKMKSQMNLILADIFNDPDLMEMEVSFKRDEEIKIKALLDHYISSGAYEVLTKIVTDKGLIEQSEVVPHDPDFGSGPAGDFFDGIDLSK